jgi:hypothetical protein
VAINDSEIYSAMLQGMALVSGLIAYYACVEEVYLSRMSSTSVPVAEQLKKSLIELYSSILGFLGRAYHYYKPKVGSDRLRKLAKNVLAGVTSIDGLMLKIAEAEKKVERCLKLVKDENDVVDQQRRDEHTDAGRRAIDGLDHTLRDIESANIDRAAKLEKFLQNWKTGWEDVESEIVEIVRNARREQSDNTVQWLSTLPYNDAHDTVTRDRLPGSGTWLFDQDAYQSWRCATTSSILWLSGTLGMGKKKLVSSVIDRIQIESSTRTSSDKEMLAYFYCQRDNSNPAWANPDEIFRSIVRQLFVPYPEQINDEVLEAYGRRRAEPGELRKLRVEDSVSMIIKLTERSALTIIVDALDECDPTRLYELTNGLQYISQQSQRPVKIFVSSRNDLNVVNTLENVLNHHVDAQSNQTDIQKFIEVKVNALIRERRITIQQQRVPDDIRQAMIGALQERAQGMYANQLRPYKPTGAPC